MNNNHVYDMLVVGGGPGGYTAALYAARAGLDTIVLEKLSAGGQMALTEQIDNYPGFEDGIDGFSLAEKMQKQAERFGARSEYAEVLRMDLTAVPKLVETSEGIFRGKTVVLATGADPRTLGVAGETELLGRGVAYCAACDGMFYKGKTVVVVGGGNSAAADALLLSRVAKKVILVHRRDALRATKIYHEPLAQAENVEFRWNSTVSALLSGASKKDVTIFIDSITRLARAYNLTVPPSGRTLSGGLDPAALYMPKRFFGAARNMREGGSLTILATALVDTGSKMDDVVYEEFKGTGNMELVLDRKLQERRVFPAIDIAKSGTRREDLLLTPDEQEAVYNMRKALNGMKSEEAVENILNMFARTRNNGELIQILKKQKIV